MHGDFAKRARAAMQTLRGDFTSTDVIDAMEGLTGVERKRLSGLLNDFVKAGELFRVDKGVYRYAGKKKRATYGQRIWNAARRLRRFTASDLEAIVPEASPATIGEYIRWMIKSEFVADRGDQYVVIQDMPVKSPKDREKIDRMRHWRRRIAEARERLRQTDADLAELEAEIK